MASLAKPYPAGERHPPKNYKNAEAIDKWKKDDQEEWEEARIKDYSCNPRLGRIVAISLNYRGEEKVNLVAPREEDEKEMLTTALTLLVDRDKNDLIVGYNSRGFDWPFLMVRAAYHRIDKYAINKHREIWRNIEKRWDSTYHVDLMELVQCGGYSKSPGSLDDWSSFCGLASKKTHGSEIYEMYKAGDFVGIQAHCEGDALRTALVFTRFYQQYKES